MEGSWPESVRFVVAVLLFLLGVPSGCTARAQVLPDASECDVLGCGGPYQCQGNGWPNFLPRRPGGPYNIPSESTFHVGTAPKRPPAECLLGTANNYLPWLAEDGRLTVGPGQHALDLSHLHLTDAGLHVLVHGLAEYIAFEVVQHLTLANNALQHIPTPSLARFPNARLLSMRGNSFTELTADSIVYSKLASLPMLRVLDLQNCSLRILPLDFFEGTPNLQFLFLARNRITTLPVEVFLPLRSLTHLDLSNMDTKRYGEERIENPFMKMIAGLDLHHSVFSPLANLTFLDLSNTRLEFQAFIALRSIKNSVRYVSYCNIGLPAIVDYLFLSRSIEMLDISYNVGVAQTLHARSFGLLRNTLEVLYFKDSMVQQLSWLAPLQRLRVLNLRGNIIRSLHREDFVGLTHLEELDLSYNYISAWNQQILTHTGALRSVNLRNNSIVILTTDMLHDFSLLQDMGLGGNTIQCSCNYLKFLRHTLHNSSETPGVYAISAEPLYADQHASGPLASLQHVKLFDYDETEYFCMNFTSNQKLDPLELPDCVLSDGDGELSETGTELTADATENGALVYVFIAVAVSLVVALAVALFYYWFHIKYFFTILKNSAILSFFNDEQLYLDKKGLLNDGEFHYDVFVSYSNADRKWVLDYLLPNMEGVSQINLCLHERDFEVGYGILENIISCMDRSRCLMLIVSESFLLSHWCQFEMHLAQHRLLETRRDELILVLLQDIPRRKCPKTLSYLLKTKTYIKWPTGSATEQALFWKRLHKSLMVSKC
ncbi:toll-like receptor 6 [Anopheles bellator]|uniref:toll-like receptor 6 n=1 Tax=Anopheles bellator TaxID=139047 RepID=UPI00264894A5|nr:toll-like receptor 6 [Anopheles bellator]